MKTQPNFGPSHPTFGSVMEGRSFVGDTSGWYRFGFGGQEKDDEIYGKGKTYSAEFWQYDSRLGRRWNVDPVVKPFESPYVSFASNPIYFIDDVGKDAIATVETKQRRFLFWTWTKTTVIIKADYHYIEGQIDESSLSAVSFEFGEFKRMSYNGARVNVRFEINFIPHPEGTELDKEYDGTNGQNFLQVKNIPDQSTNERRLEESNFKGVVVDIEKINNSSETAPNGNKLLPTQEQLLQIIQFAIGHGIGHNIGLIHADKGVMSDVQPKSLEAPDFMDPSKKTYLLKYQLGGLTRSNVQSLLNRIDEMSSSGRQYWQNETEINNENKEVTLKGTGVTTKKTE